MFGMETLIKRAQMLYCFGLSDAEIAEKLVSDHVTPDLIFLAIQAAKILDKGSTMCDGLGSSS